MCAGAGRKGAQGLVGKGAQGLEPSHSLKVRANHVQLHMIKVFTAVQLAYGPL